jgi:signal transduction histidine kinase
MPIQPPNVIIIDDEKIAIHYLNTILRRNDQFTVRHTSNAKYGRYLIRNVPFDAGLIDIRLTPQGSEGTALINLLRRHAPFAYIEAITGFREFSDAARSQGADEVVEKPLDFENFEANENRIWIGIIQKKMLELSEKIAVEPRDLPRPIGHEDYINVNWNNLWIDFNQTVTSLVALNTSLARSLITQNILPRQHVQLIRDVSSLRLQNLFKEYSINYEIPPSTKSGGHEPEFTKGTVLTTENLLEDLINEVSAYVDGYSSMVVYSVNEEKPMVSEIARLPSGTDPQQPYILDIPKDVIRKAASDQSSQVEVIKNNFQQRDINTHTFAIPILAGNNLYGVLGLNFNDGVSAEVTKNKLDLIAKIVELYVRDSTQNMIIDKELRAYRERIEKAEKAILKNSFMMDILHRVPNLVGSITTRTESALLTFETADKQTNLKSLENVKSQLESIESDAIRFIEYLESWTPFNGERTEELINLGILIKSALRYLPLPENIKLVVDIDPTLPDIRCEPRQLVESLTLILENSLDAMSSGGTLKVSASAGTTKLGKMAQITISDTGTGLPVKDTSKIFELFFSTKDDTSFGYGLWRSRAIIEEHNGSIEVESDESGSEFIITLPVNDTNQTRHSSTLFGDSD